MAASAQRVRFAVRLFHVLAGVLIFLAFYSPLGDDRWLVLLIQAVALPGLGLSGLALWQQARLNRWLGRNG